MSRMPTINWPPTDPGANGGVVMSPDRPLDLNALADTLQSIIDRAHAMAGGDIALQMGESILNTQFNASQTVVLLSGVTQEVTIVPEPSPNVYVGLGAVPPNVGGVMPSIHKIWAWAAFKNPEVGQYFDDDAVDLTLYSDYGIPGVSVALTTQPVMLPRNDAILTVLDPAKGFTHGFLAEGVTPAYNGAYWVANALLQAAFARRRAPADPLLTGVWADAQFGACALLLYDRVA